MLTNALCAADGFAQYIIFAAYILIIIVVAIVCRRKSASVNEFLFSKSGRLAHRLCLRCDVFFRRCVCRIRREVRIQFRIVRSMDWYRQYDYRNVYRLAGARAQDKNNDK